MAAEEDSEECTSKLLSTITQTTSSGGANVCPCVPPHGRLPAPLDTAPCDSYSALYRADQRWGLNSVEVFNTNNRTTVGSANKHYLTFEIFPQR